MKQYRIREVCREGESRFFPEFNVGFWWKWRACERVVGFSPRGWSGVNTVPVFFDTLNEARKFILKRETKPTIQYHSAIDTESWPHGSCAIPGGGYQPRAPLNREVRDGCPAAKSIEEEMGHG